MADGSGGPMNFQSIVNNLQNVTKAITALTQQIAASTSAIFPQTQSTSTTATAGSIVTPGDFAGFIDVTLPDGTTAKIGYFNV